MKENNIELLIPTFDFFIRPDADHLFMTNEDNPESIMRQMWLCSFLYYTHIYYIYNTTVFTGLLYFWIIHYIFVAFELEWHNA